jgi:MerR family transcriptional regulator, light-induced transcriptional regulator
MAKRVSPSDDPHDAYPIRTVARLTGLSPDLIRIWEHRYGIVKPLRGPRRARLYTRDDVEHLRLLATLVANGRSIGDVAPLDRDTLRVLACEAMPPPAGSVATEPVRGAQEVVDRVLAALGDFDTQQMERVLGEAVVAMGAAAFVREVAGPLLDEVGERWRAGRLTVVEEHILSGTLRGLLDSISRLRTAGKLPTALLAAPSGERHEFGLLIVELLFLEEGLAVARAGTDLPDVEIINAARELRVRVVGLSVVSGDNRDHAVEQVKRIAQRLPPDVEFWLGGRDAPAVAGRLRGTRVLVLDKLEDIEANIRRVRATDSVALP